MINKLLALSINLVILSIPFSTKASTALQLNCEDYNLETIEKIYTKTYRASFCKSNSESINKRYFYLGGMRKNNSDYFTLLPLISWSKTFYVAKNLDYYYILDCNSNTHTFSIYKGKELLDSELVKKDLSKID